jgi:DNA-binding MarR family transcriptional regulator
MNNSEIKNHLLFFKQNIVDLNDTELYPKIDMYFNRTVFLKNIDVLENNNLIVEDDNRNSLYSLTEKGENLLSQITEELEYELEKERITFENSKIDLRLKKWQLKTFWWIFGFGIFGGLYSGLDIIKNLTKPKDVKQQQVTKSEMELELSKLRTLILNQKKDGLLKLPNSEKSK